MASEANVLGALIPVGLNEMSRRLGVDPFETVRLLVATDYDMTGPLRFAPEVVEMLRDKGGVHATWWDGSSGPADDNPSRQRVRAALQLMLDKGYVGDKTTRMDNVWRGLPYADQGLIQQALTVLTEEGLVRCIGTPMGLQVSVDAGKLDLVRGIVSGKKSSDGLDALYEG
jgi:hypothetical protein